MYARAAARVLRPSLARSYATPLSRQFSASTRKPLTLKSGSGISTHRLTFGRSSIACQFSTTSRRSSPSGTVDEELATKIESEISLESEINDPEKMPASLKEYIESGVFKLIDKPGQEEVELVREFGNEKIRVLFSIADMDTMEEKYDDEPLYDAEDGEAADALEESAQKSKAGAKAETAADNAEEELGEEEDNIEPAFPVKVIVTIEKPSKGALQIETVAQDGNILVDSVHFHKSAEIATARTAEADWQRRGQYFGPPFANLDEDLQVLMERYLDERGINTALALFVPDYIDFKEQNEYVSWLKNVKAFVET